MTTTTFHPNQIANFKIMLFNAGFIVKDMIDKYGENRGISVSLYRPVNKSEVAAVIGESPDHPDINRRDGVVYIWNS